MTDLERIMQERIQSNHFMTFNHIELTSLEKDKAICRMELRKECSNPNGNLHGGAIYTMADNAAGSAAHSDGRKYVTQSSNMNFLRNISEGAALATGTVRNRGRKTCLVNVDVTSEETGKLLSTGLFTFYCVSEG